ncbi:hypothetical protein SISNIDRAFT_489548 [Sistotremastrum niveocremeum HHB9708]|uniref:Uncharacterized protein n=1 Tax=Sistotremastrum niveocremeum HHB9708 TaxID=1314777 RepID=A0A164PX40_9AGAM|nr:hypothetical protein SISNIDRAFT_489548 [Sistotremastrum niveocremeum HHB9708]
MASTVSTLRPVHEGSSRPYSNISNTTSVLIAHADSMFPQPPTVASFAFDDIRTKSSSQPARNNGMPLPKSPHGSVQTRPRVPPAGHPRNGPQRRRAPTNVSIYKSRPLPSTPHSETKHESQRRKSASSQKPNRSDLKNLHLEGYSNATSSKNGPRQQQIAENLNRKTSKPVPQAHYAPRSRFVECFSQYSDDASIETLSTDSSDSSQSDQSISALVPSRRLNPSTKSKNAKQLAIVVRPPPRSSLAKSTDVTASVVQTLLRKFVGYFRAAPGTKVGADDSFLDFN